MTLVEELGQNTLQDGGSKAIGNFPRKREWFDQALGQNEIRHAHAGKQDLVESPHVDHAPTIIDSLHRSERPTDVAQFTVVVFLEDPTSRVLCPLEKGEPPGQGMRDAQRVLVRWRYVRKSRLRC
jgi:hypothetical protein